MDDLINQIRQFFPSAPNLGPFMGLAPAFAAIIAIVLGAMVLFAVGHGVAALWNLGTAGSSVKKMDKARSHGKTAGFGFLFSVGFSLIIGIVFSILLIAF